MLGTCVVGMETDMGEPWMGGYGESPHSPRHQEPGPPDELSGGATELRDYYIVFAEPGGDMPSSARKLAICWCTEADGTLVRHQTSPVKTFWRRRVACEDGSVYELVAPMPEMVAYCDRHHVNWSPDDPFLIDWDDQTLPVYDPFLKSDEAPEDARYESLKRAVEDALRTLLGRRPDDESAV